MWTLLEKPKTQRATRQLAIQFAEMEPAPHDRPLSERRLQVYQRILKEGLFRPVSWATAECKETGGIYRINGKHTSTLLSGLEEMPEFYVTVERYGCDTLEDVAKLYATFDTRLQVRTTADINRSFAATVPELAHLPAKLINLAVTGMSYNKWTTTCFSIPAAERAELLLEHPEFVLWLHDLISVQPRPQHIARGPVAAAMFGAFERSRKAATDFWQAVRDETGTSPSCPDRRLAKWLSVNCVAVGQGGKSGVVRKASVKEFYVKCIHAWNAWRKEETTDLKYFAAAKIPAYR